MENLTLNVYDKKGKIVVKTCKAGTCELMFGTVQRIMALLKIEELKGEAELLKVIYEAWDELCNVMTEIFPDITDEEWNCVKVKEVIPIIVSIIKTVIVDFIAIPTDSKN